MPRPTRKVLLVPLVAAAALLGAGCSSTVPGTAAPLGGSPASTDTGGGTAGAGQTDDPVAWMDQVCGALTPLTEAPTDPGVGSSTSPEQAFEQLQGYLAKGGDAMGTAIDGLAAAGPSPIEGGDELVQKMTTTLNTAKTALDSTAQQLEGVDPNDPEALFTALGSLTSAEGLEGLDDPTAGFEANPELEAAAEQAPNCRQLRAAS
ncbi:hypothetical protein [Pseudonocardia humida]|uniref:Small secreted protein n=1 Tax=Pseudonocardia humida TaxID=2800819 RepID=A0ABT0ZTZ9_9PSEU|nr:hypothetical protein [Pseudonocardia humida]MCO1654203.1 hypothetical protein [Pseudonocardia humida]